jgi:hypothetical protein
MESRDIRIEICLCVALFLCVKRASQQRITTTTIIIITTTSHWQEDNSVTHTFGIVFMLTTYFLTEIHTRINQELMV